MCLIFRFPTNILLNHHATKASGVFYFFFADCAKLYRHCE